VQVFVRDLKLSKTLFSAFVFFIAYSSFSQTTIYTENFSSGLGGWVISSTGAGTATWINGNNTAHSSGASGNYMYSQLYSGNYNNRSFITATSPTINTTGSTNIYFQFNIWYATESSYDGMKVEYSLNNGVNWFDLGNVGTANWYNDTGVNAFNNNEDGWSGNSGGWVTHRINLSAQNTGFDNNSQVKIKILFASDNSITDVGVAFDTVLIESSYCSSNGNSTADEYIDRVQLNTINNSPTGSGFGTTSTGYSDFTAISTNLLISTTNTITITPRWTGTVYPEGYAVWIDYNRDGDFNDTGERVWANTATTNSPVSGSFTIPTTATLGSTRMRVSMKYNGIPTSCESFQWGEVEDYTINITSCTTNLWTGAVSVDWNTAANWSCGIIPTISTNVLIPFPLASGNFPIISTGTQGNANNIEFQNGTTLKVINNYIQIAGTLLLNGIIDLQGEAQLIQAASSVLNNLSTGYIERDQQGEGSTFRYNNWSPPVFTATDANGNYTTVAASLKDGTDPNNPGTILFTTGLNGAISPLTLSTAWMYKYANLPDDSYSSWTHIGSTGKVYAGEGYLMKGTGSVVDQNYVFVGKPNNGTINLTVNGGYDYLVGNPYPSAIDANIFISNNSTSITGSLYFWEHYGGNSHNLAEYQAGYATYSLGGGVPASAHPSVSSSGTATKTPGRYIAVAQGFFVVGDADGGQIQFNNGQRVYVPEGATSTFMKSSNIVSKSSINETVDTRPKFRIGFDASKISHRQLLLTIDENTTAAIDWGYDAEMYEIFEDDIYWLLSDKKYAIQATNIIGLETEFPLGIQTKEGGLITIKVDQLEYVDENISLYIKDNFTGLTHKINNQPFEINLEPGIYNTRFVLVSKTENTLIVEEEIPNNEITVFMNNKSAELQIQKKGNSEIVSIHLFNYLGQTVKSWNTNIDKNFISLPVNILSGVYIVQVNTTDGNMVKKIIAQ